MVTNLVELGRVKCDQYWPHPEGSQSPFCSLFLPHFQPAGEQVEFEQSAGGYALMVTQSANRQFDGWIERDFELVEHHPDGDHRHQVTQFHFTVWPDRGPSFFGFPNSFTPISLFPDQ